MFHRRWIAGKISEILGNEDDVVIELCFNLLEGSRFVSPLLKALSVLTCQRDIADGVPRLFPARYQVPPDPAHRISRQGYAQVLQRALEPMPQCPREPSGGSQGASRGQEAGAAAGEGSNIISPKASPASY